LACSSNSCGGVFEDEFGVAFRGEGSDEVELALRKLDQRFLRSVAEDKLANYSEISIRLECDCSHGSRACLVDAIEG
jgi:hypothetical protein